MKNLKYFNAFEDTKTTSGNIILTVDGVESSWYYYIDALADGLLQEILNLEDIDISNTYDDINGIEELSEIISTLSQDEFQKEIKSLLSEFKSNINEISIIGTSDDNKKINYTYHK